MMRINGRRLSEAELVTTPRVDAAFDRARADSALAAGLLAAASWHSALPRRWHVLTVANRCERAVVARLGDSDVEACAPMRRVEIRCRKAGRTRVRMEAAFAGYVFVKVADDDRVWPGLMGVKDVRGVLCSNGRPGVIADETMLGIIALAQDGHLDRKEVARRYVAGEPVRVNPGRYGELHAVFAGYRDGRVARVRAVLFGSERVIDVPLAKLAAIG